MFLILAVPKTDGISPQNDTSHNGPGCRKQKLNPELPNREISHSAARVDVVSVISSEGWMVCVLGNFPHTRFLVHTCLQHTPPAEATLQPLSNHSIALNVNTQLLGRKPPPATPSASNRSALWVKGSNFNISIFNAVFFRRRAIAGFEEKPHASRYHGLDTPFPARIYECHRTRLTGYPAKLRYSAGKSCSPE